MKSSDTEVELVFAQTMALLADKAYDSWNWLRPGMIPRASLGLYLDLYNRLRHGADVQATLTQADALAEAVKRAHAEQFWQSETEALEVRAALYVAAIQYLRVRSAS